MIATMTTPLLLLSGTEDRARKPEELAEIAISKPGAIYCNVPGAGHTASLEQPGAVYRLLTFWWKYLEAA